jgi:O-acetyl-ADP-ribose deacetylase (regulator of RNase III)
VRIDVEEGDISAFVGDAVVNAANNHLQLGSGVAGAIRARGGPAIQAECDALIRENGPLQVGDAAITGGGNLPARWVIHAAAMGDTPPSAASIRSSTRRALQLAAERGLESVAFPVLGSGVGGFSFQDSASLMIEELREHGRTFALPETVVLYGYSWQQADALRAILRQQRGSG